MLRSQAIALRSQAPVLRLASAQRTVSCISSPLLHTRASRVSCCQRHIATKTELKSAFNRRYSTAASYSDAGSAAQDHASTSATAAHPDARTGYLYFDSAFPIRLGFWDLRYLIADLEKGSLLDRLKASLPQADAVGHGFEVIGAEERMKDGGAFVTFRYIRSQSEDRDIALDQIEHALKSGLTRVYNPGMLLLWGKPSVHIVRGKPWREDMNRFPATRIKIAFTDGPDVGEEELWALLRPYGRILNIDASNKGSAIVTFSRMRGATSARNCAHGFKTSSGTRLNITYERALRSHMIWNWLTSHPRIVFPLIAFFIGGVTYAVFDPVRAFFIESNIQNTFSLEEYKLYSWIKNKTVGLFVDKDDSAPKQDDWFERRQAVENIQGWLREAPSTFVTISGPRGSGKEALLRRAVDRDVKHLTIDCDNIAKSAKTDATLVSSLAGETGYWPVFGWLNSLNNMIDLAAVGLIGSKAGFATPVDAQLRQVLGVATQALSHVHEEQKKRTEKETKERESLEQRQKASNEAGKAAQVAPTAAAVLADSKKPDARMNAVAGTGVMSELGNGDERVEPEEEKNVVSVSSASTPANGDELGVEVGVRQEAAEKSFEAPVVIIKHFHHKGVKNGIIWTSLAEWAAELVSNQVAHVVFVSDNPVAMSKELAKAMPNMPFNNIVLADADPARARAYVFGKLKELGRLGVTPAVALSEGGAVPAPETPATTEDDPLPSDAEMARWVDKLGGRLTDLEHLVQKVSLGQTVEGAVQDIIARTVIELRKNAFGDDVDDAKALPWSREQAWTVVSLLAEKGEINYYGLLHDAFKGDEQALKALEQAELISVRHVDGRPSVIRAGRPVFQEALIRLVGDRVFSDTQKLLFNTSAIAGQEKNVRGYEDEIRAISDMLGGNGRVGAGGWLSNVPDAGRARTEFLLAKMADAQEKIAKWDRENAELKKRLASEKEDIPM